MMLNRSYKSTALILPHQPVSPNLPQFTNVKERRFKFLSQAVKTLQHLPQLPSPGFFCPSLLSLTHLLMLWADWTTHCSFQPTQGTALLESWPCSSYSPCRTPLSLTRVQHSGKMPSFIPKPEVKVSSPLNSASCACTFHISLYTWYKTCLHYQIVRSWRTVLFVYIFKISGWPVSSAG